MLILGYHFNLLGRKGAGNSEEMEISWKVSKVLWRIRALRYMEISLIFVRRVFTGGRASEIRLFG